MISDSGCTGGPCGEKMKLYSYFLSYTKIILRWIKDLNGKDKSLNLSEERTGENLYDLKVRGVSSEEIQSSLRIKMIIIKLGVSLLGKPIQRN